MNAAQLSQTSNETSKAFSDFGKATNKVAKQIMNDCKRSPKNISLRKRWIKGEITLQQCLDGLKL